MTVVSYPLGTPPAATARGGDCRARDLTQGRNVFGSHHFATTSACRISNGLLRVTVGASGAAPTLTIAAYRGAVTVGDYLVDILSDILPGGPAAPAWQAMGVLTIDSPGVSALLTGVAIRSVTAEAITLRLVAPLMADAYVTLRRGERMLRIQHGSTRPPLVDIERRVRWTASPSPDGTEAPGRIFEALPVIEGFPRFVGAIDGPVDTYPSLFSIITTDAVNSARFGAGIGTSAFFDTPGDLYAQLGDVSRPTVVIN